MIRFASLVLFGASLMVVGCEPSTPPPAAPVAVPTTPTEPTKGAGADAPAPAAKTSTKVSD